jgi:hypothetical protein
MPKHASGETVAARERRGTSVEAKPLARTSDRRASTPGTPTRKKPSGWTAATADRHVLYTHAVQCVEAEIDFVDATFKEIRGARAATLREDFCGTAATACEWARRRPGNTAVGLDLDQPTLDWGLAHNLSKLTEAQRGRVRLFNRDVREPGRAGAGVDIVLAMNFSYWVFDTRPALRAYFESVRASLGARGVFFLDHYGGWESMKEQRDRREIKTRKGAFTYIWEQVRYEPVTGHMDCAIHFAFPDGTRMRNAFTYSWRLWTLPELRELLAEAGFRNVTVYWEGDDNKGSGNGVFTPETRGEACPAFICYLSAEK